MNSHCLDKVYFEISSLEAQQISSAGTTQVHLNHPSGAKLEGWFLYDSDKVYFRGNVFQPKTEPKKCRQKRPEWYFEDHVVLHLNLENDHMHHQMLAITREGKTIFETKFALPGEEAGDTITRQVPPENYQVQAKVLDESPEKWSFEFAIERNLAALKQDHFAIGAYIKFYIEAELIESSSTWPVLKNKERELPLYFGQVTFNSPLKLINIDFDTPVWQVADLSSPISIEANIIDGNHCDAIKIAVKDTLGEWKEQTWEVNVENKNKIKANLSANFPFQSKWAPDARETALIRFSFMMGNKSLYETQYPIGFDAGIIVRDPFDSYEFGQYQKPDPSDENFVDKYRQFLFSHLPKWKMSDDIAKPFLLVGRNKEETFNFNDPQVLEHLADLVVKRFPHWQDGLAASSLLFHHPFLTTHSSSWAKLSGNAKVNTVLKYRGCFCSDTCRIISVFSELLGVRYQVELKGYNLGLRGHLTGLVETPIGDVLLDPMLGIYYHTLDNTRLATLDEMREDKRIQLRMWSLAYNHGHEFFYQSYNQNKSKTIDVGETFP